MAKKKQTQPEFEKNFEVQNFGFFDVQFVGITLYKLEEGYGAALLFHNEVDEESQNTTRAIHHELPITGTKDEVLRACILGIVTLYSQDILLDNVMVFNEDGKKVDEFSLSSYNFDKTKKGRSFNLVNR